LSCSTRKKRGKGSLFVKDFLDEFIKGPKRGGRRGGKLVLGHSEHDSKRWHCSKERTGGEGEKKRKGGGDLKSSVS